MKPDKSLTLYQLFEQENEASEIPKIIDSYLSGFSESKVSGLFLMSSSDIFNFVQTKRLHEYKIHKKSESRTALSFELVRNIEKSARQISGKLLLLRTTKPNVYFTVTNGDLEFVNLGMKRYFEELFPIVSTLKLSSKHLEHILNTFESKGSLKVIADKTVANKRIRKGKKESAVTYTGVPFKEVFERAAEDDRWIDKIDFSAIHESKNVSKNVLNAFISRSSIYRVSNNFSLFHDLIILNICNISQTLFLLYSNRSRKQQDQIRPSKPLSIEFGYAVFDHPKKNKYLIDALKELPSSSISVIHGNPYLHASIVDFLDGSSYDLWVLSQDRLILVPQLRATYSSINRICDHIFRRFREGEVKEFEVVSNVS